MNDELASYYLVEGDVTAATVPPSLPASSTSSLGRVGAMVLPFVAALGFHGQVTGERVLVVSRRSRSVTSLSDIEWAIDSWNYTEESISLNEVRMLNELLTLNVDEGFRIDYPD